MADELLSMVKELEQVFRKYRMLLEGEQPSEESVDPPELKRLKILEYVAENQPITAIDLYALADDLGMGRQGLGGFFRDASIKDESGTTVSKSLVRQGEGPYAKISIGRYGELQMEQLQRKFGTASERD